MLAAMSLKLSRRPIFLPLMPGPKARIGTCSRVWSVPGGEPLAAVLRQGLGVEVTIAIEAPGGTAALTQIDSRQKPIRLIDERGL